MTRASRAEAFALAGALLSAWDGPRDDALQLGGASGCSRTLERWVCPRKQLQKLPLLVKRGGSSDMFLNRRLLTRP
jgi:hypothetical protein